MNRTALEYIKFLEREDSFFYKNFKDFISFASGINKNLEDEEYDKLLQSTSYNYKVTLKDKKTTVNIVKNFFYKISPTIIKQIDFDVNNGNIEFKNDVEESYIEMEDDNYKIIIKSTNKLDEAYSLARMYTELFVSNLFYIDDYEDGLKNVYVETIKSLCEFALAKHLSFNTSLAADSRNYIYKKLYNSIYKMNDSYLTLVYLGDLFENKTREEMEKELGDASVLNHLDTIVKTKQPLTDYINTVGTYLALKSANNTTNIYDLVNEYYIKATEENLEYCINRMPLNLLEDEAVEEIAFYIRNNK